MMKYIIAIEETIVDEFEVYAESSEQAMEIAEHKYKCADFVLAPGELCSKRMAVLASNGDMPEWVNF